MKTSKLKMAFIAIITAFFALFPSLSSAQTLVAFPYKIQNNLYGCSVSVSWIIYNNIGTPCSTGGPTVVPAGTTLYIPGPSCTFPSQIDVTISGAGLTSPVTATYPGSPVPLTVSPNCGTNASNATPYTDRCVINP